MAPGYYWISYNGGEPRIVEMNNAGHFFACGVTARLEYSLIKILSGPLPPPSS